MEKKKYANKYARAIALVKEMQENTETVRRFAVQILDGYEDFINNEAFEASTWVRKVLKQGKNILANYFTRVIEKNEDKDEEETEERLKKGGDEE